MRIAQSSGAVHAVLVVLSALGLTTQAGQASTLNWNFTSGGTNSGTGYNNVRTFSNGGVTVTVTGWALTGGTSNTTLERGQVGQYSTGLGICNNEEGLNCGDPAHQVDNGSQYEFMLFQFSAPVDLVSVTIDPYGTYDRDVSYWSGNAAAPLNLTGLGLGSLAGLGFGSKVDNTSTSSSMARTVPLGVSGVNSLLFGARYPDYSSDTDRFKIAGMVGELQPRVDTVPEPASMVLLGSAMAALGLLRHRRAAQSRRS